jgi:hypothetical protein
MAAILDVSLSSPVSLQLERVSLCTSLLVSGFVTVMLIELAAQESRVVKPSGRSRSTRSLFPNTTPNYYQVHAALFLPPSGLIILCNLGHFSLGGPGS